MGSLQSIQNERFIKVLNIQKISDHHQTYDHLLQTMYIDLVLEHGPVSYIFNIFSISLIIFLFSYFYFSSLPQIEYFNLRLHIQRPDAVPTNLHKFFLAPLTNFLIYQTYNGIL